MINECHLFGIVITSLQKFVLEICLCFQINNVETKYTYQLTGNPIGPLSPLVPFSPCALIKKQTKC